jgi:hypothetical protein
MMPLRLRTPVGASLLVLLLGTLLAGCSTSDDEGDGTTPTAAVSATPRATPGTGATSPAATVKAGTTAPTTVGATSGQVISDGICQASIPDDWVDDGTGHGTTSGGARYVLFGGRIASDDAWKQAVELVKKQAGSKEDAKVSEGDNFVRVDLADDRGFQYRGRFDDRYCDFSVTSPLSPIAEEERASWDAIIASLVPAAA